jgi:hypothetical protein
MATRKQWTKLITDAWQSTVDGIIKTGELLVEAKEDLDHGEWIPMIEEDLPFHRNTATRLMRISKHPVIGNATHVLHLPAAWGTLDVLARIEGPKLEQLIENGKVHPKMERKDAKKLVPRKSKPKGKQRDISTVVIKEQKYYDELAKGNHHSCLLEIIEFRNHADAGRIGSLAHAVQLYAETLLDCVKQLKQPVLLEVNQQPERKIK